MARSPEVSISYVKMSRRALFVGVGVFTALILGCGETKEIPPSRSIFISQMPTEHLIEGQRVHLEPDNARTGLGFTFDPIVVYFFHQYRPLAFWNHISSHILPTHPAFVLHTQE